MVRLDDGGAFAEARNRTAHPGTGRTYRGRCCCGGNPYRARVASVVRTRAVGKPFDVGLQAERTALAWQRTTLALAVGVLLAARLLVVVWGSLSYLIVAGGLVLVAGLFLLGYRRYESAHQTLVTSVGQRIPLTSALPLFIWSLAVFCLALCGMILAILGVLAPASP